MKQHGVAFYTLLVIAFCFVTAAITVLPGASYAASVKVHPYECKVCHKASVFQAGIGNPLSNNICLQCHQVGTGDVAPPEATPFSGTFPAPLDGIVEGVFSVGDASNRFNHGNNNPVTDKQSSHNWSAPITNPAAGAASPSKATNIGKAFYSRYGATGATVSCTRCHDPHGYLYDSNYSYLANPKLLTLGSMDDKYPFAPYNVRYPKAPTDQALAKAANTFYADMMCQACHQAWVRNDHGWLSHPIIEDYAASVAANPGKYNATLNNKGNADIKLVGYTSVSCMSCHGVHNVDSDASTVDGAGQSLSQSNGKMLRGDGPAQVDKSSLCQTCHTYLAHGSNSGESVGCLVCHSGHSYDPDYPNYYVLRKTATTEYNTATGLDYSDPSVLIADQKYKFWNDRNDGSANGYCEKCHGDVITIPDGGTGYHVTLADCTECHLHGGSTEHGFKADCTGCHSIERGARAAVTGQFASHSHHVQGVSLTNQHCYQCHWEAKSDGKINVTYHGGKDNPGASVDLVVYGSGTRPTTYGIGSTAISYNADNTRTEITKINDHCLGCHSDQNSTTIPFGDGKTPQHYAWDRNEVADDDDPNDYLAVDADGTSIESRFIQTGTTTFGKYTNTNAAKKIQTKSYSAHGKATLNQGGWSAGAAPTGTGVDGILPNTRNGSVNIACYDCHNSHGSMVAGKTTSYESVTVSGGILKDTQAGIGGYSTTYKPVAGGAPGTNNVHNAGASLCFDCHLNSSGGSSFPWGYQATFGATQKVIGYYDSPYFSPGSAGPKVRYPYKASNDYQGGHFGASSPLSSPPMGTIDGLCTPCHDPHGVSPNLGSNQQYSVPLLKGTWLTSPYPEDAAPGNPTEEKSLNRRPYHIDQNTFGSTILSLVTGITEEEDQFAGLCLKCHKKTSLTGSTRAWMSKDRIHESVKGWKPSGTIKHNYSCSKCHSPHMGSVLPRLMVTNCLDPFQKGRGTATSRIYVYGEGWGNQGQFPKVTFGTTCHEARRGNSYKGLDQKWNDITPYNDNPSPVLTSNPTFRNRSFEESWEDYNTRYLVAGINWGTNVLTHSMVEYGTSTDYGQTYIGDIATTQPVDDRVVIWGLLNHRTYHYKVHSQDNMGRDVSSEDYTFSFSYPPTKPVLKDEPNVISTADQAVTLVWNASSSPGCSIEYQVQIDDNSDFSSVSTTSPWVTSTNYMTPIMAAGKTWYWRVLARDVSHPAFNSGWTASDAFIIHVPPPSAPVLIDTLNIFDTEADGATALLDWNPSSLPIAGGSMDYSLQLSNDPGFSTTLYNSGWITGTEWTTPTLATDTVYYWRVKSRYDLSFPVAESAWTAADRFSVYTGTTPLPVVTLLAPANGQRFETQETPLNITFQWQSVPAAHSYSVEVVNDNGGAVVASSGWISSPSWTKNIPYEIGSYGHVTNFTWSVIARDALTMEQTAPVYRTFYNWDSGTCPFLYTWDGEKFAFEADLYPGGKLATKTSTGYLKPNPHDYYVLRHDPVVKDGTLELRIVEERYETDYLDELTLYTVDVPESRQVFPELPLMGEMEPFPGLADVLHTVSTDAAVPQKIIHVNTGQDVTQKLAANDEDYVVLSNDRNLDFTYQTLELDLGDIQLAPQVKIVMDALSMFPTNPDGVARAGTFGPRTKLEVQDEQGNWVSVPKNVMVLPKPYEFTRPYLFDISNIWISDSRKVRFTFLFKTYVDWIIVDTTEDLPVAISEVPMLSAELNLHGNNPKSNDGELYEYVYSEPNGNSAYMPGSHTRFGDVLPLLTDSDDKFVIYGGGDQMVMTFEPPDSPAAGLNRSLIVYTNGYYKDMKVNVPHTVEPLPFAGMSNFPYDETVEEYPNDAEHNAYRTEYNTRTIFQ